MTAKKKTSNGTPTTAIAKGLLGKKGDKASVHRDAVVRREYKMQLPVKVGHEKWEEASTKMADLHDEREKVKTEKREVLAKFRDKLNSIDDQMGRVVVTVRESTELVEVACVDRLLPTGVIETVRLDLSTLVEDARVATAEERQEGLPGIEAEDENLPGPKSKAKRGKKRADSDESLPF